MGFFEGQFGGLGNRTGVCVFSWDLVSRFVHRVLYFDDAVIFNLGASSRPLSWWRSVKRRKIIALRGHRGFTRPPLQWAPPLPAAFCS